LPLLTDWDLALDYAAEQGWIENLGPGQYRLTDTGFAIAQATT
jgi:hypothetical protein